MATKKASPAKKVSPRKTASKSKAQPPKTASVSAAKKAPRRQSSGVSAAPVERPPSRANKRSVESLPRTPALDCPPPEPWICGELDTQKGSVGIDFGDGKFLALPALVEHPTARKAMYVVLAKAEDGSEKKLLSSAALAKFLTDAKIYVRCIGVMESLSDNPIDDEEDDK